MSKKRFRKGMHGRYHVLYPDFEESNGQFEKILLEPTPNYFQRPGDTIITAAGVGDFKFGGVDNNASIILGRDRAGLGEEESPLNFDGSSKTNSASGFSDYMGAGAIDIVVGRMAPFPTSMEGFSVGPCFRTKHDIPEVALETLAGVDPRSGEFTTSHPGYIMDAARIYISQMTSIDYNFDITSRPKMNPKDLGTNVEEEPDSRDGGHGPNAIIPYSGIMLKADKVRMHSRHDIKIVTGGESRDSQGENIVTTGGIHLIAGNKHGKNQPIPLGYNLVKCLGKIVDQIQELSKITARFAKRQQGYNDVLSRHTHLTTPGTPSCISLKAAPEGQKCSVMNFLEVQEQLDIHLKSLTEIRNTYLETPAQKSDSTKNDKKVNFYINSIYNSTN